MRDEEVEPSRRSPPKPAADDASTTAGDAPENGMKNPEPLTMGASSETCDEVPSDGSSSDSADDDGHEAPGTDYHAQYDRRADLARMTSRRSVMAFESDGQGRVRSGSRCSSVNSATCKPAGGQVEKVLDLFRQVNDDARVLRQASAQGMSSCCNSVSRTFSKCLRKIGLGNPDLDVENIEFNQRDPLDLTVSKATTSTTVGHTKESAVSHRRLSTSQSVTAAVEEETEDDEDEEHDTKEIYEQKRKVNELGELPALDWTNVTRKLTACVLVCGALIATGVIWDGVCVGVGQLCLRQWCYALCIAIGAYFLIELAAKGISCFFRWTRLLHTSNYVWIFIKVHKDVSLLLWSILTFFMWLWFTTTDWIFDGGVIVLKILGCLLTFSILRLVHEICQVTIAHQYMWKPYLERAKESIWAQYVIFMLTDFVMGVETKDREGQALAIGFTRARNIDENMSLYTVGKAISFVLANALKHPLGPGRPGTDSDGIIDSKMGARLFGGLLYDALMVRQEGLEGDSVIPKRSSLVVASETVGAVCSLKAKTHSRDGSLVAVRCDGQSQLPRPGYVPRLGQQPRVAPWPAADSVPGGVTAKKLGTVGEDDVVDSPYNGEPRPGPSHEPAGGHQEEKSSPATHAEATVARMAVTSHASRSPNASVAKGKERVRVPPESEDAHQRRASVVEPGQPGTAGHHRRISSATRAKSPAGLRKMRRDGITLALLRQMTAKSLALKIMELFEVAPDEVISRKAFVNTMVEIFVQRRSLQLTLGDYEVILDKMGYLLAAVSAVVFFFVALRILGYDIGNLVLTWLSLAVAFSFLFGSSASAFFESIIFVFVTKAYDVGDPVYFVDDTGQEDWYVVTRINLLTTVFRRWDGQATLLPNSILAKKGIRNQWRSGPLLHHTMIAIDVDTPLEKVEQMKQGVAAGMRRGHLQHRHGKGGLLPDTVDYQFKGLTDGNKLAVFVMCKQRHNGSNTGRRFSNGSLFLRLIAKECRRLEISYTMPPQSVTVNGGLEVLGQREAFLSGEGGK